MLAGAINTNVNALYALNSLTNTANKTCTLEQQLSSGQSINSPADNPAGYIAAQGFTTQIGGIEQAISNANQAISLVQTADGAITQQINLLQQIQNIGTKPPTASTRRSSWPSLQQVVSQLQTQVSDDLASRPFSTAATCLTARSMACSSRSARPRARRSVCRSATPAPTSLALTSLRCGGQGSMRPVAARRVASATTPAIPTRSPQRRRRLHRRHHRLSGSAGHANVTVSYGHESAQNVAASVNAVTPTDQRHRESPTPASPLPLPPDRSPSPSAMAPAQPRPTASLFRRRCRAFHRAACAALVNSINQPTGQTGITATVNANDQLVLDACAGDNISITDLPEPGRWRPGGARP